MPEFDIIFDIFDPIAVYYEVFAVIIFVCIAYSLYQILSPFRRDAEDFKRYIGFDHETGKPRFKK